MDSIRLQDRYYYALGIIARRVGRPTDAFRPSSAFNPLEAANRFLRLDASFVPSDGSSSHANSYGMVQWQGRFDASYTRVGDYLVQADRTFFIAGQQAMLPVLCIQTNRSLSIARPNVQATTASNAYGGYMNSGTSMLLERWPASVLAVSGKGDPAAGLPTDQAIPYLAILVPALNHVVICLGDIINDDLGRSAVVTGSELTDLGWRLSAKMATT